MKRKILLICVSLVLVIGLVLAGCAKPAPAPEPVTLKYASLFPPTFHYHAVIEDWAAEVEKRTEGMVKIDLYPASSLLTPPEMYDGILKGIADIGAGLFGYSPGRFLLAEAFEFPLGFKTSAAGTKALWETWQKFPPEVTASAGTHFLYAFYSTPNCIWTVDKPINKLEDLGKMKIRLGADDAEFAKLLGVDAIVAPQDDAYEMLAKGIADGTWSSLDVLKGYHQAELVQYICIPGVLAGSGFYVTMNLDVYNSLSPDIQKVIDEVSREAWLRTPESWDAGAEEGLKYAVEEYGCEAIYLSPEEGQRWLDAGKPQVEAWMERCEAKGLPAQEFYDELLQLAAKYK